MTQYKRCSKCKEEKLKSEFGCLKREKDGLNPNCKLCKRAIEKQYFAESPTRRYNKAIDNRLYKYGVTEEDYQLKLLEQNYCCAICKIHLDGSTGVLSGHVDHDHTTKKIRGLLCGQCNVGLGHFYENEDSLLNAIQYLRKYK